MGSFWFWTLVVVGALAGMICVVALVGWMLPKEHKASRSAEFAAAPQTVWQAITNFEEAPQWRRGLKSIERLPDHEGKPAWKENGRNGPMPFFVEVFDPPRRYVARIIDKGMPFGGAWIHELTPLPNGGCRLEITEDGVIYNPIFRALAHYVFGYTSTMEGYLNDLRGRLESK